MSAAFALERLEIPHEGQAAVEVFELREFAPRAGPKNPTDRIPRLDDVRTAMLTNSKVGSADRAESWAHSAPHVNGPKARTIAFPRTHEPCGLIVLSPSEGAADAEGSLVFRPAEHRGWPLESPRTSSRRCRSNRSGDDAGSEDIETFGG